MRELTDTFEAVTITVGRPTNRMRNMRDEIYLKLGIPDASKRILSIRMDEFAQIVAYTTKVVGFEGEFPQATWDKDKLKKAFDNFCEEWDGALTEFWVALINRVMAPIDQATASKPPSQKDAQADPN